MGLLDKIVKEEVAKNEQKTREEMEKLSVEVLKLKREKEIAAAVKPVIEQALKEFPDAMKQIGVDPLPLVVAINPKLFTGGTSKCMWGYYLYPSFNGYELFMTSDGKYHTGITTYSSDRKVTDKNKRRVRFYHPKVTKPFQRYEVNEASASAHEEVIPKDEAVSLITKDLISQEDNSELRKTIGNALDRNDYETAVATLFSEYIAHNVKYNKRLLSQREELDFLRRMNKK